MSTKNYHKVDLSKLKRHRGAKDAAALEELVSNYRKQMLELQGQINQMTPNMRVSEMDLVQERYTVHRIVAFSKVLVAA